MKEGAKHWLWERVTAVALIPLSLWFLASIIAHSASDHGAFVDWLRTPTSTSLMILLLAALFYHISLGLQVIIEDGCIGGHASGVPGACSDGRVCRRLHCSLQLRE